MGHDGPEAWVIGEMSVNTASASMKPKSTSYWNPEGGSRSETAMAPEPRLHSSPPAHRLLAGLAFLAIFLLLLLAGQGCGEQPGKEEPLREVWKRFVGIIMTSPLLSSAKPSGSSRMMPTPIPTGESPATSKATGTRPLSMRAKPSVSSRIM